MSVKIPRRWIRNIRQKRKARCDLDKKPFKFTKKLFEEEKKGILDVPKETLEAYLLRKYSDPLADTPMCDFRELNRLQPLEETFDNSPIKLGEVKDFVWKARAESPPGINGISYKLYKDAQKFWHLFGNSYKSRILKNSPQRIGDEQMEYIY